MSGATKPNPLHTLKSANRHSVLDALRRTSPASIACLAETTGLSKVTVSKCVEHYVGEGLALCDGKDDAAEERGKKPLLYSFNNRYRLIFCVKIDEVHMLAALTDLEGRIVSSHSVAYNRDTPLASVLSSLRDSLYMLLERAGKGMEDCVAAVVGCHGVIDPELGICFVSPHFSGWGTDIPIRRLVENLLPSGLDVHVDNWIHFHAFGEVTAMSAPMERFFLIGTEKEGVAGGLVIDGRMYRGSGSLSGEIAHMIVDTRPEAEPCECGGKGCLEASVSPIRMERKAMDFKDIKGCSFAEIAGAAEKGSPSARMLMDEAIVHWAVGITSIVHICDPDCIIIQGEYANAGTYFLTALQEKLQTVSLISMRKTVELAYSRMGDEGTIRGAGTFAAERYFAKLRAAPKL